MTLKTWVDTAQLAAPFALIVSIVGLAWQTGEATTQQRISSVARYAELNTECRAGEAPASRSPDPPPDIVLWDRLCAARILSNDIVINDLIRATAKKGRSLLNLDSAHEISKQLEDGLVRELQARAKDFL